jgi:asparagine synthetase B (glutamine-hydrolysing)
VVGIHNGVIANDEEIFARNGIARAEPGMTVDSEAIFALVHRSGADRSALEELRGTMAAAWMDERVPRGLCLARGVARPLWIGRSRRELFFASTKAALEVVEGTLRLTLRKHEVAEGRLLRIDGGTILNEMRFRPDTSYRNRTTRQPVATPHEGVSCLAKLAALTA